MKYEKPSVAVLSLAIDAIQTKDGPIGEGGLDPSPAYEDWE